MLNVGIKINSSLVIVPGFLIFVLEINPYPLFNSIFISNFKCNSSILQMSIVVTSNYSYYPQCIELL